MKRLGVFGGTFDPPHIGHLVLAQAAYDNLNLAKVIFVPAAIQPHKQDKTISQAKIRLEMLRLALGDDNRFEISEIEIERKDISYTCDTLKELKHICPESELYFIMGGDNIADLETWKAPEEILQLASVYAAPRPDSPIGGRYRNRIKLLPMPLIDISSTMIRELVSKGKPIKYLVQEQVEQYIMKNKLYK